jgi:hypothetical protein
VVKDFKKKDFKMKTKFFFLILSFFSSCSDDFEPKSYLARLEVLALKQDGPLLLTEDSDLNITPVVFETEKNSIEDHTWTICPVSKGSRSNYECAIPSCENKITGDTLTGKIDVLLGTACLSILKAKNPKMFSLTILYTVKSKQGEERKSLLELPLSLDGNPPPPLTVTAPAISEVKINNNTVNQTGTIEKLPLKTKIPIIVTVTKGKGLSKEKIPEDKDPLVYFYSTVGKFKASTLVPKSGETTVEAEWFLTDYGITKDKADLYIIVRDETGGQTDWIKKDIPLQQ